MKHAQQAHDLMLEKPVVGFKTPKKSARRRQHQISDVPSLVSVLCFVGICDITARGCGSRVRCRGSGLKMLFFVHI